jgi:hypothetical protein
MLTDLRAKDDNSTSYSTGQTTDEGVMERDSFLRIILAILEFDNDI